jgi:CRISPR type III-A-associated RAMP protein Csm4
MNPGLVVKLRPSGAWRIGPDSGARNAVDVVYHSDALYAAVTSALAWFGERDAWLEATARAACPAVRFSSCFPSVDEVEFIVPPRTLWPPTSPALIAARVRWKSARFVPLGVVQALLRGEGLDENRWTVDGVSGCLIPSGRPGPFRTGLRAGAAVDRLTGATDRHVVACLEFRPGAGLWTLVSFSDETARDRWAEPVRAAFRYLADSGFGGERSRGWGRTAPPEFIDGLLPDMILPFAGAGSSYWLLSLFSPAAHDQVDWSRGDYTVVKRAGRIESPARWGDMKKQLHMVAEGSVLAAGAALAGAAPDVAPDGFPHPVFRAGFAVAIPLPAEVRA